MRSAMLRGRLEASREGVCHHVHPDTALRGSHRNAIHLEDVPLLTVAALVAASGGALAGLAVGWLWRARSQPPLDVDPQPAQSLARQLELLSEHADDVVLIVDDGGRIVRANDRVVD